ncbi:DNA ligase D [Paenirhodobacter populi]|uniref:DNA ligase (ATP) n=1 Tax=Paenirhodobacter populi TaxID=2306993 RepID=A0A443JEY4_9RHOB|nr:DNA ligase D [Sinirhodobacter populi]RWR19054.1 DNA ligase D [Sinirhodobacter populi]
MATLDTYRKKRDFAATPEPKGRKARKAGHSFVIQKHAARRLHYDLRLEMDGVLRSWAVTKGPSLVAGEKRLAVQVEDHPLSYGDFEGTIPKGSYGGGTVIVWDRGTWTPVGDAEQGYAKGHLEFELHGDKLTGRWHLVRMRGKRGETRENWLLIKADDAAARPEGAPDILVERPESVKTGRLIEEVAAEAEGEKPAARKTAKGGTAASRSEGRGASKAARAPETTASSSGDPPAPAGIGDAPPGDLPDFVAPELATLRATPPSGARWLHEIKFDGYRLQARIAEGEVKLLTRSGLDWTDRFGTAVVAALRDLPAKTALIDGELVVETGSGASDFPALQADLAAGRLDRFTFYAFDLLHLDGRDLRPLPLIRRKAALETLLGAETGPLRYSRHFDENGALVLRHACRLSLEGVISKLRDAPYRSGRTRDWVKSKCSARQEFVVAGYMPSGTMPDAIGSLILGVHEKGGGLRHVGRVGTGFTAAVARDLHARLAPLEVAQSPFDQPLTADQARQVHFVRPELVAEVEFRAWTADGQLRHASFRGLREDKPAAEIIRETPTSDPAPRPQRRRVKLTHPDRLYWPDEGVTKEGLADYYTDVWRRIAPHITGRPLALLRGPDGIAGQTFFQKHAWKGLNPAITLVPDPAKPGEAPLVSINDLDGLIGLVQAAVLEIHPWGATLADWEHPDTLVMDLDPGEGVAWEAVITAAREVRERLQQAGLEPFVKTSGGKGLHVVAPLKPEADWPALKAFTKAMAVAMAADSPALYVATITKAKRRGRILIDYLRNQRGMTAVAPYSPRARPGAAVSMPLGWSELGPDIGPRHFTIGNTPARLAALDDDPWADFRAAAAPLKV